MVLYFFLDEQFSIHMPKPDFIISAKNSIRYASSQDQETLSYRLRSE